MNGEMSLVGGMMRLGLGLRLDLDLVVDDGWMGGFTVLGVTSGTC